MASNSVKKPFLRVLNKRTCTTNAAAKPSPAPCGTRAKTCTLPNKLVIASLENNSPISRICIAYRAGSRYETASNLGVTHMLRIAAGLSTRNCTQFGITRNIQKTGGNLSVTSDREIVGYTLEVKRNCLDSTLQFINEVATQQVFKPWELMDNIPRLKCELASIPPSVRALELLHKAAFRIGLGNSIFCPEYKVGKITCETLQHYVGKTFTTNRAAVVGVGISNDELMAFANNLDLESGEGTSDASPYRGGEIRQDTGASLAYVAVATEGASSCDPDETLASSVLQYALGVGPSVKWGSAGASLLGKAMASAKLQNCPFAVSAFNINYSDTGLLGFLAVCPPEISNKVVRAAIRQLKQKVISEEDVERGKAQLKTALMMAEENGSDLLHEMAMQALLRGKIVSGRKLMAAVDCVSAAKVNALLSKMQTRRLSMGAVGNLSCVPYLDDLSENE